MEFYTKAATGCSYEHVYSPKQQIIQTEGQTHIPLYTLDKHVLDT